MASIPNEKHSAKVRMQKCWSVVSHRHSNIGNGAAIGCQINVM